jgi:hypothetical protein
MKKTWIAGAVAASLLAGVAFAQDDTDVNVQTTDPAYTEPDTTTSPDLAVPERDTSTQPVVVVNEDTDDEKNKEAKSDMRGLTWGLGGGVEGYTGALAPAINPGPAWGVTAALKPSKVLGLELGYNGAVNEIDDGSANGAVGGADIIRNGGQLAATVGLTASPVQPYILGGVGINRYNVRGSGSGFRSDTSGNVPVGAGLRTHIGNFTADLRANYNVLFDNDFATAGVDTTGVAGQSVTTNGGRYNGMLQIGGTF